MTDRRPGAKRADDTGEVRPLGRRLIHATGELVLSFLLAAGLFLEMFHLLCLGHRHCAGFGGIPFMIASLVIAGFGWATYLGLCRRFRTHLRTRRNVDIAAAVLAAAVWMALLLQR